LTASGTYTIVVKPSLPTTAINATLTLSQDISGTLTANATPTTFATTRVGQNAHYTFSATAGQSFTVGLRNSTFTGSGVAYRILLPDGSSLTSGSLSSSTASTLLYLSNLAQTGTYTVVLDPNGSTTGQITVQLQAPATGVTTVGGSPLAITQAAGQLGYYTFSGTQGQQLKVALPSVTTTPTGASVKLSLLGPDGVTVLNTVSGSGPINFSYPVVVPNVVNPGLPYTGTYTVVVDPMTQDNAITGTVNVMQFRLTP
jgi:hypothetical protein